MKPVNFFSPKIRIGFLILIFLIYIVYILFFTQTYNQIKNIRSVLDLFTWMNIFLSVPFFSITIGFLLGIIGSFIFWLIIVHLTPNILFLPHISWEKAVESPTGYKYLIGFENIGYRNIIDVELFVKIGIPGLMVEHPFQQIIYTVPTGYTRIPKMNAIKSFLWFFPKQENFTDRFTQPLMRITRLDMYKIQGLHDIVHVRSLLTLFKRNNPDIIKQFLKEHINETNLATDPKLLHHLLSLNIHAYVEVTLLAYDEFSSTRKVFIKKYTLKDIIPDAPEFHVIYH